MALEIRHLRLIVSLRTVDSLNRAAVELGITQPTASRMITQIERHIGTPLLERGARGSVLTALGEAFAQHAAQTVASFEALMDPSRWQPRALSIAYAWGGLETTLTAAVRQWPQEPYGGDCRMHQDDDPLRSLESGAVDLALIRGPVDAPLLSSCALYREDRVIVLPVDSPLAHLSQVGLVDLQDMAVVVNLDSGTTGDLWADSPRSPRRIRVHGVDEWIVAIASAPSRFGVTPASTMSYYTHPGIITRPSEDLPDLPVSLAWRRDEKRAAVHEFISLVKDSA